MVTVEPGEPDMLTLCTSVPLIQATNPSSTIAPKRNDSTWATFVMKKVFSEEQAKVVVLHPGD
jgi:hypothetical protein